MVLVPGNYTIVPRNLSVRFHRWKGFQWGISEGTHAIVHERREPHQSSIEKSTGYRNEISFENKKKDLSPNRHWLLNQCYPVVVMEIGPNQTKRRGGSIQIFLLSKHFETRGVFNAAFHTFQHHPDSSYFPYFWIPYFSINKTIFMMSAFLTLRTPRFSNFSHGIPQR